MAVGLSLSSLSADAWFPSRHSQQVGAAQLVAAKQHFAGTTAFIVCTMALGLAAQLNQGFGWGALAWQCIMGALAATIVTEWRRGLSTRSVHAITAFGALWGSCWAIGLCIWSLSAPEPLPLIGAAASLIFVMHVVSTCYFAPWSVVAFSSPLVLATLFVSSTTLDVPAAPIAALLVLLQALASFRLLRKNWSDFAHSIDMDVETSRLAAMLQEQKEIAERAVQLKTRFLASASHDLRQPMHAISLYLDGLAEVDLPERVREAISDAKVCAHDMNDMFRSLLDISRLDAQQAIPTLSSFGMESLLSRVEKEFQPLAASRGVKLKVRPCLDHVYSDPVMVERIVLNLVSNAVRHTPGGRVLVACRVRGRALRVAVYDTGPGIPESQQQAIFEEFYRLDTSRPQDNTGGVGLGLAIVRRLSQSLHLRIIVRSTPGRGSMFAVDLPLVHVAHKRAVAPRGGPKLAGRQVIVVDDEVSILRAASFILESSGCEVIAARSGREALMLLANCTRVPDFLVCDYELKGEQTGAEVIRQLREEFNCDIPAMLVTGNTSGGGAERSARELAIPVLYKPLEAHALRSALEALLVAEEQ
jgi:signal transduction histidine kinase/ActR/RegA family two-component response regulator